MRLVVGIAELPRELQCARHLRQSLRVLGLRCGRVGGGEFVAALLGEQRLVEQQLGQQVAVVRRLRQLDADLRR